MLIQAESGLASITGGPEAPARVGVSVCDIAAGMDAYEAVLEALIARGRTGEGAAISISMFDAMADWMATPLLQQEGGAPPRRIGLAHTSIAPYGVFKTKDGADILISIQSDREWRVLAERVLGDAALARDPDFASNVERVKRRAQTDGAGAGGVRRDGRGGADGEARRRRHRVRAGQRHRGAGAASAAAADYGGYAVGAGVDAGAGRAAHGRGAALRAGAEARRAHGARSGPSFCRMRNGRNLVSRAKPRVPGEWSEAERDPGPSERIARERAILRPVESALGPGSRAQARARPGHGTSPSLARDTRWVPSLRPGPRRAIRALNRPSNHAIADSPARSARSSRHEPSV